MYIRLTQLVNYAQKFTQYAFWNFLKFLPIMFFTYAYVMLQCALYCCQRLFNILIYKCSITIREIFAAEIFCCFCVMTHNLENLTTKSYSNKCLAKTRTSSKSFKAKNFVPGNFPLYCTSVNPYYSIREY